MSSPMMNRMFGFLSCACRGPPAPMSAAVAVNRDRPCLSTLLPYISLVLGVVSWKFFPPEDAYFVREGSRTTLGSHLRPIGHRRPRRSARHEFSNSSMLGYERRLVRLFARNAKVITRTGNKQRTALICILHFGVMATNPPGTRLLAACYQNRWQYYNNIDYGSGKIPLP
jgi:hypothetical protein